MRGFESTENQRAVELKPKKREESKRGGSEGRNNQSEKLALKKAESVCQWAIDPKLRGDGSALERQDSANISIAKPFMVRRENSGLHRVVSSRFGPPARRERYAPPFPLRPPQPILYFFDNSPSYGIFYFFN